MNTVNISANGMDILDCLGSVIFVVFTYSLLNTRVIM